MMIQTLQLLRSDPAHIGAGAMINLSGSGTVQENKKNQGIANRTSFENYLVDAVNYVNEKQQATSSISQKLITDPDSVDVHDVTIAMAEANLSLSLAQNVIQRLTQAWSEITTNR